MSQFTTEQIINFASSSTNKVIEKLYNKLIKNNTNIESNKKLIENQQKKLKEQLEEQKKQHNIRVEPIIRQNNNIDNMPSDDLNRINELLNRYNLENAGTIATMILNSDKIINDINKQITKLEDDNKITYNQLKMRVEQELNNRQILDSNELTDNKLNELLGTSIIQNNKKNISIIWCDGRNVEIIKQEVYNNKLNQRKIIKVNKQLDSDILSQLSSKFPSPVSKNFTEKGIFKILNENNTSRRGFTVKYDNNGKVLNENEIINNIKEMTILNNALDKYDDVNNKNVINISYSLGTPSLDLKQRKINSDRFKGFMVDNYCKYTGISGDTFLKSIIQSIVEYRPTARLTYVLHGPRGVGKDLFLDMLDIIFGVGGGVYDPDSSFNDWLLSPMVRVDEKVSGRYQLWIDIKKYSTKSGFTINTKYGAKIKDVEVDPIFAVTSNERPITITDEIKSSADNPIVYLSMEQNTPKYLESLLLKYNIPMTSVAKELATLFNDFLFEEGFKLYHEILKEREGKSYRYGMPVEITNSLRRVMKDSIPTDMENILRDFSTILEIKNDYDIQARFPYNHNDVKKLKFMVERGSIQLKLMSIVFEKYKVKSEVIRDFFMKHHIISSEFKTKRFGEYGNISVYDFNLDNLKLISDNFVDINIKQTITNDIQSNKIEEVKSNVIEPTIIEKPNKIEEVKQIIEQPKIEIKQELNEVVELIESDNKIKELESELKSISKRIEELEDDLIPNLSVGDELLGVGLDYENELKSLKNRRRQIKLELK